MSDWIIRPGELMPGMGAGFGVWQGGKLHDLEKGQTLPKDGNTMRTMQPMHGHLCPHKLNPVNCLTCFHNKQANAPREQPKPRPGAMNPRPTNPVIAAVRAQAGMNAGALGAPVPQVQTPVIMGKNADGTDIVPPKREVIRGPMPRPVLHGQNAQAGQGVNAQPAKEFKPFSYADQEWKPGKNGEPSRPPRRPELIASLPRHPDADK